VALSTTAAQAADPVYVALGDSYTSAPLISRPVGEWGSTTNPYDCGKSDENYPHRLARHLGVEGTDQFVDVSCGSARTKHMDEDQTGLPFGGTNRRQFAALEDFADDPSRITLVSVGIGGNDLGFGELQDYCVQPPEAAGGRPCREHYENVDGAGDPSIEGDIIQHRLGLLEVSLAAVIDGIRSRAPNAEILVYGYPALLPEYTDGCYPYIPILPTDAAYLREAEKDLNRTIRDVASAGGAHYVDWYSPSIGHDMCQPPGLAWVNGVVLAPPSYPVHPNLLGTWGAANAGIGVLESIDFDFSVGRGTP
jgi:hypothetical protein